MSQTLPPVFVSGHSEDRRVWLGGSAPAGRGGPQHSPLAGCGHTAPQDLPSSQWSLLLVFWPLPQQTGVCRPHACRQPTGMEHSKAAAYLNWQKMSAYSGRMPLACSTVTRKVKALPSFRWVPISSENPSMTILPSSRVPDFKSKKEQMNTQMVQIVQRGASLLFPFTIVTNYGPWQHRYLSRLPTPQTTGPSAHVPKSFIRFISSGGVMTSEL